MLSSFFITVGGIGTIAAVALICVFLVGVALPLFGPAKAERTLEREAPVAVAPLGFGVDELRRIAWSVLADGRFVAFALHDGTLLADEPLFDGERPTAAAFPPGVGQAAFGFADGSLRLARLGVRTRYLDLAEAPPEVAALPVGGLCVLGRGVAERISTEQVRVEELAHSADAPLASSLEAPLVALGLARVSSGLRLIAADAEGKAALLVLRETRNMLSGATSIRATRHALFPREQGASRPDPRFAQLSGGGDSAWLAWADGTLVRWDVRDPAAAFVCEEHDLVPESEERLECLTMMLGQTTLVSGDSLGRVRAWFLVRRAHEDGGERLALELAHDLARGPGAVRALAPSERSRVLAVAHADGAVRVHHLTSERTLLALDPPAPSAPLALALAPRQDALFTWSERELVGWELELEHPEASFAALFRKQWYEGYPGPEHVWQSSSGTDDFEPKLGLVPLVFGTLKATFYSMLFGVPLALLAALYTSEFLARRLRSGVKSSIEMMASLPSVVLGFLAALVIAPFVQGVLSSVLACLFTIPAALLLGARLWQLLPVRAQMRLSGLPRLALTACALPLGVAAARVAGPWAERALFGGDLQAWLGGGPGGAAGGWTVLLVPPALLAWVLLSRPLDERLRRRAAGWSERAYATADLLKALALALLALLSARIGGELLAAAGLDARGSLVGTYVQRNALVVGFVMGFAIVPIIYTLAEDALASVPEHLRQASLGAGATPWQTAVRVVVPTAMSGLFSALMIGLGRAVGETMIVLMATGNTPVLEWNVFNGFRTLSANIAVELPEAVQGDTHYRTLFLAALVLFGMTFLLNTLAEVVRQRFRRRAFQL